MGTSFTSGHLDSFLLKTSGGIKQNVSQDIPSLLNDLNSNIFYAGRVP